MIAMSLVNNPELLIADEPTTALDVTVQAQILDLIRDLQKEFGSAVIIITHDLGVVAELADDILVMYGGRCVERGTGREVFYEPRAPLHLGSARLDAAAGPGGTERLIPIKGSPPCLINLPSGCSFHPRCPYADVRRATSPARSAGAGRGGSRHCAACHLRQEQRRGSAPKTLRRSCERRHGGRPRDEYRDRAAAPHLTEDAAPRRDLLEVTGLQKHFPITKGLLKRQVGAVRAVDGIDFERPRRRDPRPGGRVRLRQVHHGPADDPAAGADRRQGRVRGPRHHAPRRRRGCARCAATCR